MTENRSGAIISDSNCSAAQPRAGADQALSSLRVVDLSRWIPGEFCTKLFADFGADVVKVERPGEGSLTRRWGLFPGETPNPEASPLFLHLNTNKRSLALDLASPEGREHLVRLAKWADLVVESFRPGTLERLGIGPTVLRAVNPRLVITRISAFGQSGPYRDYEATGLTLQAVGGALSGTGAPDLPPHRRPGNLEDYVIGRMAAEASLAGLIRARNAEQGGTIDVSGMEVLLTGADASAPKLMCAAYSGMNSPRGVLNPYNGGTAANGIFRARDGYVTLLVANQHCWDRLVELVAEGDDEFRNRYLKRSVLKGDHDWDEFIARVQGWFDGHSKLEIMERGQAQKIPLAACMEVPDLLKSEHFRTRSCFVSASHPVAGDLEYMGAPWRMDGGWKLRRTAPLLGADTVDVLRQLEEDGPSAAAHAGGDPAPDSMTEKRAVCLPLAHIRVVDLTVVNSGPGATMLLGDLGAEVIRVEDIHRRSRGVPTHVTKEDVAFYSRAREIEVPRGYHRSHYPHGDPGERPYNRCASFNWHARNKLSVSMSLDKPEGHAAFMRLVRKSDVFIENNSSSVLGKLDIDWPALHSANPRLILVRAPLMGLTGQMSHFLGYGSNLTALVGIQAMDGYPDRDATVAGDNFHMDEATPAGLALAVLMALWQRERTGRGQLIEFAQAENVLVELGEYFLDYQMTGRKPLRLGNGDPQFLQDVFPTAQDDVWIAISIRGDRDWNGLAGVVGQNAWIEKGQTPLSRRENAPELKRYIAEWTRLRSAAEIVSSLQRVHVPAMEVMSQVRLLEDPHLEARDWFKERNHPAVGTFKYPGHPWRADSFDLAWGRPVASFGEDNDYVYKRILGYSEAEIEDLTKRGLIGTEQKA